MILNLMVDIDDVLFPLAPKLHSKALEMGLHDGTKEALEVWHGDKQYGCTREEWLAVFGALADEGYYVDAEPIPGAVEAVRKLYWAGHNINLVTARGFPFAGDANDFSEKIRLWTAEWIAEHGIPGSLTFSKDKVAAMSELGFFNYAIDDGEHNYLALNRAGVNVYLLDQPHNRASGIENRRISTVAEWAEVILHD